MAAVVVSPFAPADAAPSGEPLSIFQGSATPTVFPANAPFWIGSAFVPEPGAQESTRPDTLDAETRFELDLDGEPVRLATDLRIEEGRTVEKLSVASFRTGLSAGWHRFAGRWYVAGKLVLTSDKSIEFVER
jgi:hypothetical protein